MMRLFRPSAYLALMLCGMTSAAAAAPSARLTASDIFNLEFASDPQISPDGKRIVYVRGFSDVMSDRRLSNLWIVDFDGSNNRPLTTGLFVETSPRWSPDGTRLIFTSDRYGSSQICVIWPDSGQMAKLTNLQQAPREIAWSPDGTRIGFAAFVPEPQKSYASVLTPPAGAQWNAPPRIIDMYVYRQNGPGYLRPGHTQLFVMPAEGGTPRQVTSGPFDSGQGRTVWTPDGKGFVIAANRQPGGAEDVEDPRGTEIFEVSVSDGAVKALTKREGPDRAPAISPDGKQIAYVGFDDKGFDYQVDQLYVMNRDGSGSRVISAQLDRDVDRPQWAPDGSGIYVVYDDRGATKLGFYSLDGKLKDVATDMGGTGRAGGGKVSYGTFSLAANGNYAYTYTRPNIPADIAVGTSMQPAKVITALNRDLFDGKTLGEVEEIWYPSSLDGRKIQGWVMKPPDFDPSKKYPLILEIHGGPLSNYGARFDAEKQLMAAAGYIVFYPNWRGSTGFGFEFSHLIEKVHPGIAGDDKNPGDVTHDMNSGIDALIAKGSVDANNLFVTGLSGGGTLTMWMIEHTDRFRAAVPSCPSGMNWASFVLYANRPGLVNYRFPGPPWEHAENYTKRSPLSLIKNIKTPTMILAGDEDWLTPIANMEEYYFALRLLKVETVLIRFPGETHGITRFPSHQATKMQYLLNWFEQHKNKGAASTANQAGRQ